MAAGEKQEKACRSRSKNRSIRNLERHLVSIKVVWWEVLDKASHQLSPSRVGLNLLHMAFVKVTKPFKL